jgi:hypothetical protein
MVYSALFMNFPLHLGLGLFSRCGVGLSMLHHPIENKISVHILDEIKFHPMANEMPRESFNKSVVSTDFERVISGVSPVAKFFL